MPLPTVPGPWSFYRLGPTKEKELFKRHRNAYDGVVIPAHIASYYATFCAEFIGSLQKPYFVDPITYVFARNPRLIKRFVKDKDTRRTIREGGRKKKGDIKRSYLKLVEGHYGGIIKTAVLDEERPLRVSDFKDAAILNEIVERVVAFQRQKLSEVPDKYKKYQKYAEKAGKRVTFVGNLPMIIVPPYFLAESIGPDSWHMVNVNLARRTKRIVRDLAVFGVIFCTLETLARNGSHIVSDYSALDLNGYLLWVDGFTGEEATATLRMVRDFISTLSKGGKPIISLYGNALSLVLNFAGLTGFSCGICYAERKSADQDIDVEGVIPPSYYIELLKKKIRIETEAKRVLMREFPDLVCDCAICRRNPEPATLDDTESREHFMLVRAKEIASIREGMSPAAFATALRDAYDKYRDEPVLRPLTHLLNWSTLLSETAED